MIDREADGSDSLEVLELQGKRMGQRSNGVC